MSTGVLFDLDGTLVDTVYLHTVTWWQALREHGHDVPMAAIHRSIGMGSDRILDHLVPDRKDRDADEKMIAGHSSLYAAYWSRVRPTPGARDLVRAVHDRDVRVVLASSAGPPELEAVRKALDIDEYVDSATGAEDADSSKPAPDIVRVALDRTGLKPTEAVFVGDSIWDVQACGALDVPCVGLLTGGWSEAELRDAGAVEVYQDPAALLKAMDSSVLLSRG